MIYYIFNGYVPRIIFILLLKKTAQVLTNKLYKKEILKENNKMMILIQFLIMVIVVSIVFYPFEGNLLGFKSHKIADRYYNFTSINGELSLNDNNYVYFHTTKSGMDTAYYKKQKGKWYYNDQNFSKIIYLDDCAVHIEYQKMQGNDMAVLIYYSYGKEHHIKDNIGTNFIEYPITYHSTKVYYTVLNKIPEEYTISVDGEQIKVSLDDTMMTASEKSFWKFIIIICAVFAISEMVDKRKKEKKKNV